MIEPYRNAQALLGSPYRPQGRDPGTGLDCIGLVLRAYGLSMPDPPTYRLCDGDWVTIEETVSRWFDPVPAGQARADDLLISRLRRSFHFAICGPKTVIHVDLRFRKVVEAAGVSPWTGESRFYRMRTG